MFALRNQRRLLLPGLIALFAAVATALPAQQKADRPFALVAPLAGPIGPASARFVERVLEDAAARRPRIVVFEMDTPGGLSISMRRIIRAILASPVPVATFVAPPGARAASAGTYILYASHIAAMAPGTNLGAATPIKIGGSPLIPGGDRGGTDKAKKGAAAPSGDTETRKAVNDAVAYIRALAELRGRNADWAEQAVRAAASLSATAALDRHVIDLVAPDVPALLRAIDGRTVKVAGGERVLKTAGLPLVRRDPGWITRLLAVITNPNVALILMMVGFYGLVFEFLSPGSIGPGVLGAICLLLGLYALNLLPLDYAGLGLVILGIGMMIAEGFAPTLGALGVGGAAAFVIGAILLVDTDSPAFRLSYWVIGGVAAVSALMFFLIVAFAWRAHRRPVTTGAAEIVGHSATVLDWQGTGGYVRVRGEEWQRPGRRAAGRRRNRHRRPDRRPYRPRAAQCAVRRRVARKGNRVMITNLVIAAAVVALIVFILAQAIFIFREYERGVMFTLGRFTRVCGPGFVLMIPVVQKAVKVDLRTFVDDVPAQDVISRDNVSVKVNAVLYYRIVDPELAINRVENYVAATSQLAQTTLRSVLGKHELDEMLAERDKLNRDIQAILDAQTDDWGIKVANVEIKHVDINDTMVRAIAKQAEAERVRRAKVINAEGEQQAAQKLVEAAALLSTEPQAIQLRYLGALQDISNDRTSTIVFPFPLDLMQALTRRESAG